MSLKLRTNDLTSYKGWFFLLRTPEQQPMILDLSRGPGASHSFQVNDGFVCMQNGDRICDAPFDGGAYVIGAPDSLITIAMVLKATTPPQAEEKKEPPPPEIVPEPRLLVA